MRLAPPGHSLLSGVLLLRALQPVKETAAGVLSSLGQAERAWLWAPPAHPAQQVRTWEIPGHHMGVSFSPMLCKGSVMSPGGTIGQAGSLSFLTLCHPGSQTLQGSHCSDYYQGSE